MRIVDEAGGLPGAGCVLVPTMGALHEGHLSLIRLARARSDAPVVVSVFVNPTQFNDPGDLARYPRDLGRDAALCASAGADVVFAPAVETVYPPGAQVPVPPLPAVATEPGLEDMGRPGHFAGVCQVVSRLCDLCRPRAMVFGEKDWQQLQVARALMRQQRREVEVWAGAIVREADGLAMSSRNVHLSAGARRDALALSRSIAAAGAEREVGAAEAAMRRELEAAGAEISYAAVRDAETLLAVREGRAARAVVSAVVGGVRLLDNGPWGGV
jgi:pantoate--beta-alanine ligase